MDARQQLLLGMEPEALRLHHLFFAVLPGSRAVEAAVGLAQALVARRGLQARLHATLLSLGWEGTLSGARVVWARAAAQRVVAPTLALRFDRVLSFRGGTTPHTTLRYRHQLVPEMPVPSFGWTARSFVLLHNLRGSLRPYKCLVTWVLMAPG